MGAGCSAESQRAARVCVPPSVALIHEVQLVRVRESHGLVDMPSGIGCMQGCDANSASARFGKSFAHKISRQASAAIRRLDPEIEEIAAMLACGIEWMRRPFELKEAGRSSWLAILLDNPSHVFAGGNHAIHPRHKVHTHSIERCRFVLSHLGKHRVSMCRDQGGVCLCSFAG